MSEQESSAFDAPATLWPRRGPLHARLAPIARQWRELNGYQVCAEVQVRAGQDAVYLCELSHRARVGIKGHGAAEWLAGEGVQLPAAPNRWLRDDSGALLARLGAQDFLIGDDSDAPSGLPESLAARWQAASGAHGHLVPRQQGLAHFMLGGAQAAEVLARLCAVDLRPRSFARDAIAQTQIAMISAIVLRSASDTAPVYSLFIDTSLALYLWEQLADVAQALGGQVLGIAQLPGLLRA